jgi:5-methyltetrahydropteroyltriglutamate--homocysteine methyltransferase
MDSHGRILTKAVGSFPRPPGLAELIRARNRSEYVDPAKFTDAARLAIRNIVGWQKDIGLDLVSNGEMPRPSFMTYVLDRLSGFGGGDPPDFDPADMRHNPHFDPRSVRTPEFLIRSCDGPVTYADTKPLHQELDWTAAGLRSHKIPQKRAYVTSVSPDTIVSSFGGDHYKTRRDYLRAVATAVRTEYQTILSAGDWILQIDAPGLIMPRHTLFQNDPIETFLAWLDDGVDAFNYAVRDLPRERIFAHVCFGNYPWWHVNDVPFSAVLPKLLELNVGGLSFPAANPQHEWEIEVFAQTDLSDRLTLVPGVVDTLSPVVEHRNTVRRRALAWADVVPPERLILSSDCGFATFANAPWNMTLQGVEWKLRSLVEGAALASQRLARAA